MDQPHAVRRLKDLLGPVTRVKKKKKEVMCVCEVHFKKVCGFREWWL